MRTFFSVHHPQTASFFSEKGPQHILRDYLRMLVVNFTNGGQKRNNFWGKLNEDVNKPEWWPSSVPFSSPNIRERDATPGRAA